MLQETRNARASANGKSTRTPAAVRGNVYDNAFRTIAEKMPTLLVPLINLAFGTSHPPDAPIAQLRGEHVTARGVRYADSAIGIGGLVYHIECQSRRDPAMPARMFEYGAAIAVDGFASSCEAAASAGGAPPGCAPWPRQLVVYLDRARLAAPPAVRILAPDGSSANVGCAQLCAQAYDVRQKAALGLHALLPFETMRYRRRARAIAADPRRTSALLGECARARAAMESACGGLYYNRLLEVTRSVAQRSLGSCPELLEKVGEVMFGQVMEFSDEKIARLERENAALGATNAALGATNAALRSRYEREMRAAGVDDAVVRRVVANVEAAGLQGGAAC